MQEPRSQAGANQARRRQRTRQLVESVPWSYVLEGYLNGDITKVWNPKPTKHSRVKQSMFRERNSRP